MDFDVEVEILRAFVTALIVLYLWRAGRREQLQNGKGWRLILAGFSLILFASLLDISDNFPALNQYVVIGKTHTESFLEKIVGYLFGFIAIFIGLSRWMPQLGKLRKMEALATTRAAELEQEVSRRTIELQEMNKQLQREARQLAAAKEEIRQMAYYDALTQLPNRRLLDERLMQAMAASKRSRRYCAMMFLDLDNFKQLNDKHGHGAGDRLLKEVAQRLMHCVREMDTVARLGGDEFVVVLNELSSEKQESIALTSIIAEKIRSLLAQPYELIIKHSDEGAETIEHSCTSSIGVIVFTANEISVAELFKQADAAMYQAKDAGRNAIRFSELNQPL